MATLACARPADAGRVFLALVISAVIHAAVLLPPGAPRAYSNTEAELQQPHLAGLPLQLTLHANAEADPDIPSLVEATVHPLSGTPTNTTKTPQTVSIHESVLPFGTAARYYLAHELDVRPQIRTRINPDYPRVASEQGISANLIIRIYIDETGRVEKVTTSGNEPPSLFAEAVSAAFMKASYTPGIKDGKPVKSLVLIEVDFEALDAASVFRRGSY